MKSSVIGIVYNSNKSKLLLIKRRDVPVWVFPGGGIDPQELPEDAVCREVLEETGIKVKILRKVGEYTPINSLAHFTHVFECMAVEGELETGAETRDINYFPIDDLPKSFFMVHFEWLLDSLENREDVIKKPIASVTYWALIKYFLQHPVHVIRFALSRLGFPINSK